LRDFGFREGSRAERTNKMREKDRIITSDRDPDINKIRRAVIQKKDPSMRESEARR